MGKSKWAVGKHRVFTEPIGTVYRFNLGVLYYLFSAGFWDRFIFHHLERKGTLDLHQRNRSAGFLIADRVAFRSCVDALCIRCQLPNGSSGHVFSAGFHPVFGIIFIKIPSFEACTFCAQFFPLSFLYYINISTSPLSIKSFNCHQAIK